MLRFVISTVIIIGFFLNCSKCSREEGHSSEGSEVVEQEGIVSIEVEDAETSQNKTNDTLDSNIIRPNIRFIQTPDGKVIPEAVFKLKFPKMLNPQILKEGIKRNEAGDRDRGEETQKEERK
ncbi:MAG: hypothetical protein N2746_07720 [Deltaproteobacteria bacterium]|nr:hypothetical protein [Deltaproteobacteria bacterium]